MGLFPRAPKVNIYAPTIMFVGRASTIEIEVVAAEETTIDFIDARVVGRQGWRIGSGKNTVRHEVKFPELATRLREAGVLPAGTSRFSARFELPATMPPSHEEEPGWARLELHVHVSIPWWPDGRYRYALPVRVPPPAEVTRTPAVVSSSAEPDEARIEISIASGRLVIGETLVGSCAIYHLDDKKPREVELSLVPALALHRNNRRRDRRGTPLALTLEMPAGSAGTSIPFQLRLPASMTPSFKTVTHELAWWLIARSGSFFGKTVEVYVPLDIVDASAAVTTERLVAAPRLADERVDAIFQRFSELEGWQPAEAREDGDQAVEIEARDAPLSLRHAYRGKDGTFLVARLGHAHLGLCLEVTRSAGLFRKRNDIYLDLDAWDRAHLVSARIPNQATPFLKTVVPHVESCKHLGELARWSDDEIVFERKVANVELDDLSRANRELRRLANAIAAGAASIAPPFGISIDEEAWRDLARFLRGELCVGELSIDGELDGRPVELAAVLDRRDLCPMVRATVGDPELAGAAAREVRCKLERPSVEAARAPEVLRPILAAWPDDLRDFELLDGTARAALRLPAPPIADAGRVRELAVALRALLASLEPATGPYR